VRRRAARKQVQQHEGYDENRRDDRADPADGFQDAVVAFGSHAFVTPADMPPQVFLNIGQALPSGTQNMF
jgi:hypothetical protein